METILYEVSDGIAHLTLNRPDVLNSINPQMIDDIRSAVASFAKDRTARVLLLTGNGRAFCSGADLATGVVDDNDGMTTGQRVAHGMKIGFNPLVLELAEVPKPVISAVNGITAGGGVGLALSADIVVAARSAYFMQVFGPKLALIPDMGCTWFVPRLVGRARARALAFLGNKLSAEMAADWGLILDCVDDDKLMDHALVYARKLADGPPNAFGEIKKALTLSETNSLSEQLDYERDTQGMLGDHPNFKEGVVSFLKKKQPEFTA
ncbi:MAG: enoyl-CoA hydratase [Rhodobiaceae bacterium]|nr:MAG: enoyl-CoA hydratase [Rhodobiaceae bacterium]